MSAPRVQINLPPEATEQVFFRGLFYIDYLKRLSHVRQPRTYLEIGTKYGDSLKCFSCSSLAIDPDFQLSDDVAGEKSICALYQMTSEEFFSINSFDPENILGNPIDIAFIDGMHLVENILDDFINVERYCHIGSKILLHDCIPAIFEVTNRIGKLDHANPRFVGDWTGDVWRIVPILRTYRPDLSLEFFDCPPSGILEVGNCDRNSGILTENREKILENVRVNTANFNEYMKYIKSLDIKDSRRI